MSTNERRAARLVVFALAVLLAATLVRLQRRPAMWGDGGGPFASIVDARVDINGADAMELASLPGIGPTLAERIVRDRERHGPFATLDDLDRVRGVGPALIERLAGRAVAGDVHGADGIRHPQQ
ncbi:MAG: ComEA family DNA-binding protein [Phycisphaerales bacterium]